MNILVDEQEPITQVRKLQLTFKKLPKKKTRENKGVIFHYLVG